MVTVNNSGSLCIRVYLLFFQPVHGAGVGVQSQTRSLAEITVRCVIYRRIRIVQRYHVILHRIGKGIVAQGQAQRSAAPCFRSAAGCCGFMPRHIGFCFSYSVILARVTSGNRSFDPLCHKHKAPIVHMMAVSGKHPSVGGAVVLPLCPLSLLSQVTARIAPLAV